MVYDIITYVGPRIVNFADEIVSFYMRFNGTGI